MEKDLVYLIWTDTKTGNKYRVSELYKKVEQDFLIKEFLLILYCFYNFRF